MRGRKKFLGIAVLLSVMLIVPLALSLGVVDVPQFLLGSSPASSTVESASSSTEVLVDPAQNVTDYEDLVHNVTIGSTVTFYINISDVTELFSWQINVNWDPSILNASNILAGEFLARAAEPTSSEELGFVINSTGYAQGYATIAESILGDVSGITEPSTGGLVSIEFEIVGYGWTYLNITASGTLPTMLLNSTGDALAYYRQLVPIFPSDGYFRNVIFGDMTDDSLVGVGPPDGDVDGFDLGVFAGAFGASVGLPKYYHLGDLTDDSLVGVGPPDGDIDGFDLGVFAGNFGRITSIP